MAKDRTDVVIVGAGLAGLRAADALLAEGATVRVLEARDRVGGRVVSETVDGSIIELGGRWIGDGQTEVMALAKRFGRSWYEPYSDGRTSVWFGNEAHAGAAADPEIVAAVRQIDALADTVNIETPWASPDADKLDQETLQTYLERHFDDPVVQFLRFELSGFLPEPWDVSLLHALFYLKSNHGFAGILGLDGIKHDAYMVEGGTYSLAEMLAKEVGDVIRLSAPVSQIEWSSDNVTVRGAFGAVEGRAAIVSIPPALAGRIDYEPAMPHDRDYLTQRAPIRGKMSFAMLFDTPVWRDEGLNGFGNDERLVIWGPGGANPPGLLQGLVSIPESRRLAAFSQSARRDALVSHASEIFGLRLPEPRHYSDIHWAAERYSRGCNSYLTPGVWIAHGHAYRAPVGPIYWAGAEYAAEWVGQMDGALETGRQAAERILVQCLNRQS